MYNLYVKKPNNYNADLIGEYTTLNEALDIAKKKKEEDNTISYTIEEVSGHVDNYGEPIAEVVRRG